MNIDWNLARIQYEYFNISPREIAEEFGVTERMVEYAKEQENWKHNDLALILKEKLDVGDVDEELLESIQGRLALLSTVKFSALLPSYVTLEAAIIGKCINHIKSLDASNAASAANLKMVAEVLKTLRDQKGDKLGSAEDKAGSLTVKILNRVDTRENTQDQAIEISV